MKAGSLPRTLQSVLSCVLENHKACATGMFLFINCFSPRVTFAVESIVHTFMFSLQCNVPSLPLTLGKSEGIAGTIFRDYIYSKMLQE